MSVELQQRILVAIPAIAIALGFVIVGEAAFSVFLVVLGILCLHELFAMFPTAHASRLAGYLGIIALVVAADLGGRALGRRPLAPSISPNKTVEGLAFGIVTGTFAVWCAGLYQDWLSGTDALILGAAVACVAPLGDLFESYLKRDAGTKDTGRAFGAHGGALDRLDAVLFTVIAGYYVWRALM